MTAFSAPRQLGEKDNLSNFCCGVEIVDDRAHRRAHKAMSQGTAVVYVCLEGAKVAGLYSLSAHSVARSDVKGGWLRRNTPEQIPAVLLGMLGVDKDYQGQGLGRSLLRDAILRAQSASREIGARALLVDPAGEGTSRFYEQYGFKPLPETERLFLPLH